MLIIRMGNITETTNPLSCGRTKPCTTSFRKQRCYSTEQEKSNVISDAYYRIKQPLFPPLSYCILKVTFNAFCHLFLVMNSAKQTGTCFTVTWKSLIM